jgi:predicted dinucleotide-binding enzyme
MKIGIIGSGALGSNIARALAKKGISATIANKSGPVSVAKLLAEVGPIITTGTIEQAASADIVIVAVPWVALETEFRRSVSSLSSRRFWKYAS